MSEAEFFATAMPGDDFVYLAAFQQLVLERTNDLITVLDPSGTIVYASPSWQTLAGWDPDALVGTAFLELTDLDDPELGAAIVQVLAGAHDRGRVEPAAHTRRRVDRNRVDGDTHLRRRRRSRLRARNSARRQ